MGGADIGCECTGRARSSFSRPVGGPGREDDAQAASKNAAPMPKTASLVVEVRFGCRPVKGEVREAPLGET